MKERKQTVCPVCGASIKTVFCSQCGFDSSRNYERYPTLAPVRGTPSVAALWAQRQKSSADPGTEALAAPAPKTEEKPAVVVTPAVQLEPPGAPLPEKKPRRNLFWLAALAAVFAMVVGIWIGIGIGGKNDSITVRDSQPERVDPVPVDTLPPLPSETDGETEPQQGDVLEARIILPETLTLKVWAPQEDQIDDSSWLIRMEKAFEDAHPECTIYWENGVCAEGDAATLVTADPALAADVYMYANDHMGRLINAGALAELGGPYLEQVKADNNETFVGSVTYADGGVYGFPVAPNTWFMFYNKAIVGDADITSLEAILEKGTVAFEVSNSWYLPAFFFAAGGSLFGDLGVDAAAGAQFGGQAGYAAARALLTLAEHPNFECDGDGFGNSGLKNGTVAAYFSGDWDYAGLYEALGADLGAAAAPTVMIDGERRQLQPYAGTKVVGVNPYSENQEAAMAFAAFLASAESQKLRFDLRGIVPAAAELQSAEGIRDSICAQAIYDTMDGKAAFQPKISEMDGVWSPVGMFGWNMKDGLITMDNYKRYVDELQSQMPGG